MRNIFTDHKKFAAELNNSIQIGGCGVVELRHQLPASDKPQLQKLVLLPGRGMNTYKLEAFLPGHGSFQAFDSLPLEQAEEHFAKDDPYGNLSFTSGGAFLIPYGNRIRGPLDAGGKTLSAKVGDRTLHLPANWKGQKPGAERHAMHGLILNKQVNLTEMIADDNKAAVRGVLECEDFWSGWPSHTNLDFYFELRANAFEFHIKATNVGNESTPIGMGWHPYFTFPSGKRDQVRLKIPAKRRALSNNLDDVFPTGEIVDLKNTRYDFSGPQGNNLGDTFFDDAFMDFYKEKDNAITVDVLDPAANYGMRVKTWAPPICNFQFYAPTDKAYTSIEPQVNMPDPFSEIWSKEVDRGMVWLEKGQSLDYKVSVEILEKI
jgi:galactose mutarotase-like enzyme